jgi:hypothetical protein
MADKLKAINKLRPKLALMRMVEMDMIEPYVSIRSGVDRAGILHILNELRDAISFFSLDGRAVRIEGLGRFIPKIGLDGSFTYSVAVDVELQKRLNNGDYKGEILNRDNIGKTWEELITLWNKDNPGDLVV